jgi:hypothetical protein
MRIAASWCQPRQEMAEPLGAVMTLERLMVVKVRDPKGCHPEGAQRLKDLLRGGKILRFAQDDSGH